MPIKPTVKTTEKGNPRIKEFLKRAARERGRSHVSVGVHDDAGKYTNPDGTPGPTVAEVALWNEFGTRFAPERSFIRSALAENNGKINKWRAEMIDNMAKKGWTLDKALRAMGFRIQQLIQNKIKSNVPPPLAASTARSKRKKGIAPVTLIDSGLLLRSIGFKVEK